MISLQQIKTNRLLLRRWSPDDLAPFAEICADPDVMSFIGNGSTRTINETARSIATFEKDWDDRGYGLFAVEQRGTGALLGFTGFSWPGFLPEVLPSVEIGWRFANASWGNGYAAEAALAALSFGVDRLGLTDLVSLIQVGNNASVRIAKKLGMARDRSTIDPSCGRKVDVYRLPNA